MIKNHTKSQIWNETKNMAVKIKKNPWLWCKSKLWNKATHNYDIKSQIMTKILKFKIMKYYDIYVQIMTFVS